MEEGAKLVQPSLAFTRQLCRQTTKLGSMRYRHCPLLAKDTVVHPLLRDVNRDRRHASGNKRFLSTEAIGTRGGRARPFDCHSAVDIAKIPATARGGPPIAGTTASSSKCGVCSHKRAYIAPGLGATPYTSRLQVSKDGKL
jgi:hypothetical protein